MVFVVLCVGSLQQVSASAFASLDTKRRVARRGVTTAALTTAGCFTGVLRVVCETGFGLLLGMPSNRQCFCEKLIGLLDVTLVGDGRRTTRLRRV